MAMLWGTLALHVAAGLLIQELPGQPPRQGTAAAPRAGQITLRHDTASVRNLVTGLPADVALRVRVIGGPRVSGRSGGTGSDAFVLRTPVAQTQLRATLIDSVWTRERPIVPLAVRAAASGALVGFMLRLERTVRASCSSGGSDFFGLPRFAYRDCRMTAGSLAGAVARGAVIGFGVGAAIGAVVPKWRLRFP